MVELSVKFFSLSESQCTFGLLGPVLAATTISTNSRTVQNAHSETHFVLMS